MSKIVLVAGYTKSSYLEKIRSYFNNQDITLGCVYTRLPSSEIKEEYLKYFDTHYYLVNQDDRERLQRDAKNVLLITCTQERDMNAYIEAQTLCGIISKIQADNYRTLIDKEFFKKSIQKKFPELVPSLTVVNDSTVHNLDTIHYPVVIKPTGLAGSTLVKIVNNALEFKSHYESFKGEMTRIARDNYQREINIIAEEYISGPQYSVNVYVNKAGTPTFCPIVRVVTPNELGINDTYSALQYTTDELVEIESINLKTSITNVINYFGVVNTSMHFDCVLNNGQWKFFEVGLRIGGNRQKLFELSHNMDHFTNDIRNRFGKEVIIPSANKSSCIVQKASTIHGRLEKISYTRTAQEKECPLIMEDKISKIGVETGPVSEGGGTIIRHFVVGKNHEAVLKTSKQLFEDITFHVS